MGKMSTVNLDVSIKWIDTSLSDFNAALLKIANQFSSTTTPTVINGSAIYAPAAASQETIDAEKQKLINQYKVFQKDCYPLKSFLNDLKTSINYSIDTLTDAKKLVKKQVLTGSREDKITSLTNELENRISELNSLLNSVNNFLVKLNSLPQAPMTTIRAAK